MSKIVKTPRLTHYGKKIDEKGNFIKWVSNPNKNKRTKTSKFTVKQLAEKRGYKEPFCFFCGRTKRQLGLKETLTLDHIKELNEGGEDRKQNLQILCTACHKLKNWKNTYIRKHLVEQRSH